MATMDARCAEYARLQSQVTAALQLLADLTSAQLEAFQSHNQELFMRLDKDLENAVGLKEWAIGAMREHAREHGCQPI